MYTADQLDFFNWVKQDDVYVTREDSQIIIENVNAFVRDVQIHGAACFDGPLTIKVFYTENLDETFMEDKSATFSISQPKENLGFFLGKEISDLRIDLTESSGDAFSIESIEINGQPVVTKEIDLSQVEMINWEANGDHMYRSLPDHQIIIRNLDSYVEQILLSARISLPEGSTPRVFYIDEPGEEFSEEKSFDAEIQQTEEGCILEIGRKLSGLRIDLSEDPGLILELNGVEVNPRHYTLDWVQVIFWILIAAIFFIPVYKAGKIKSNIRAQLETLKKYRFLLKNLVMKDVKIKYRRSVLGIFWSVLNPLLMMMIITAVFQNLFKFNIENFPVYYLTGILIFNFISEATVSAMGSVLEAGPLIRKVYIPKYIFPVEKCLFAFVNMLFTLIALVIMLFVLKVEIQGTIWLFWVPLLFSLLFSIGLGLILAALYIFFRDIGHLYNVGITAWMYLTPIIYPMDILKGTKILAVVKLNPIYFFVDYFRQVVIYGCIPDAYTHAMCLIYSMAVLVLGLFVFKKTQDRFILFV